MSQSFSLYTELTVRQNLRLHARLFHLPRDQARQRIRALIQQFGLGEHVDTEAAALPLGIRQRLSLAVAVVHEPDLLILDEPTSGVDPLARDAFWELLIDLSRRRGVTIFVSTHFMNEAERCDRIAMMHAGRVLAIGTPAELVAQRGVATLEDAFIAYLEQAEKPRAIAPPMRLSREPARVTGGFSLRRMMAYTIRELLELWRDPVRLGFAVLGIAFLMLTFGFGINTDTDHIAFAALDADQTTESRAYLNEFTGSRVFRRTSANRRMSRRWNAAWAAASFRWRSKSRRALAVTCGAGDRLRWRRGSMVPCRFMPRACAAMWTACTLASWPISRRSARACSQSNRPPSRCGSATIRTSTA